MARTRDLRPGFFKNEGLAELSREHRLLFAGLWGLCDRRGVTEDRPRRIKPEVFPYDDDITGPMVDAMLNDLANHRDRFIIRYVVDGARYIAVTHFAEHQRPHPHEAASELPLPGAAVTLHGTAVTSDAVPYDTQNATQVADNTGAVTCNGDAVTLHAHAVTCHDCGSKRSQEGTEAKKTRNPDSEGESEGKPTPRAAPFDLTAFARFWAAYPKKRDRGHAEKAWRKIKPDDALVDRICAALEMQRRQWTEERFIPYPATWLNGRRWEDEPVNPAAPAQARAVSSSDRNQENIRQVLREAEERDRLAAEEAARHDQH